MNPVEIEEAVTQLASEPFDRAEFPFQFLTAFGNKKTTIDRLRKGNTNQSDLREGVLQRSNIHIVTCDIGAVTTSSVGKALVRSTRTGGHFSNVSLSLRFKAIYLAAGIKTSSHSGRRTFATQKNALGIGMRTIQHLLGHANIATTALYCDVSDEQLANAANAY